MSLRLICESGVIGDRSSLGGDMTWLSSKWVDSFEPELPSPVTEDAADLAGVTLHCEGCVFESCIWTGECDKIARSPPRGDEPVTMDGGREKVGWADVDEERV